MTAGGGTERRLPGVIAAARHRSGCGTSPDARYGAAVALRYTFCLKMRSRLRVSNKVVIDLFVSPTAVCGPFCGCLSVSALVVDRAAEEQSQSPPHDPLKPLGGGPSVTLWRLERRCARRCGAAANDRDGGWRDRTAAPRRDCGGPTPLGVRDVARCPIWSRRGAPLHFLSQNALSVARVEQGRNRLVCESDGGMRAVLRVFERLSARGGPCGQGTVAISAARSTEAAP